MHAGKAPGTSTGHDGAEAPHKLPIRTLVAASVGNAVEWYDWTVYATFSIYFATQIFSAENESLAFIRTFTTYALAFFFRPLGGSLLGRYADLKGRKQAMLLTIMLMAGGSLVIAILPTYAAVGWLAPILLLLARIAQGMSLGGEVSSASAYLGRNRTAEPPRPLLVILLHLHRHRGTARLAARCLPREHAGRRPAGQLGVADPVPDRRRPRPRRAVDAPRHGRDRAVREERRQG